MIGKIEKFCDLAALILFISQALQSREIITYKENIEIK
jgi:hypothetical protein